MADGQLPSGRGAGRTSVGIPFPCSRALRSHREALQIGRSAGLISERLAGCRVDFDTAEAA